VDVTWLDPEHLPNRELSAAVAVLEAARALDRPYELGPTVSSWSADLRHGWDGDPSLAALGWDAGRVAGVLEVTLPGWDNRHMGIVELTVDPLARRRGVGRRLFEAGLERVRAQGRTLLVVNCLNHPAGTGFAEAMDLDPATEEVHRRQDLLAVDWESVDREHRAAERHAAAYELLRLPGATPEEMLVQIARMTEAINDAPRDALDSEDEVFTPERIRAFDAAQVAHDRRMYRLVARERSTGLLAGHTVVGVESERPWYAGQFDTSVARAHRGHRLGLWLKIEMLYWLRQVEPQLRILDTENAATNTHMIRVNELLGYRVLGSTVTWQRRL
jgi:GNAT superfamily N-acetyltransferase